MKSISCLLMLIFLSASPFALTASGPGSEQTSVAAPGGEVVLYYFHFTRRCMTCNNVEKVSKEAVEKNFPEQVKSGKVAFRSVNLEEKEGEALGARYKIEGQSLVVISGDRQTDLTDKGFLWANSRPEKLSAEISKAIGEMLKK